MSNDILKEDETVNTSFAESRFLRLTQILTLVSVSKSTIWNWVKKGTFPKPCKLSPQMTAKTPVLFTRVFLLQEKVVKRNAVN